MTTEILFIRRGDHNILSNLLAGEFPLRNERGTPDALKILNNVILCASTNDCDKNRSKLFTAKVLPATHGYMDLLSARIRREDFQLKIANLERSTNTTTTQSSLQFN